MISTCTCNCQDKPIVYLNWQKEQFRWTASKTSVKYWSHGYYYLCPKKKNTILVYFCFHVQNLTKYILEKLIFLTPNKYIIKIYLMTYLIVLLMYIIKIYLITYLIILIWSHNYLYFFIYNWSNLRYFNLILC